MKTLPCSSYRYIIGLVTFQGYRYALYNTQSYPLMTQKYPNMFGTTTLLQSDYQAVLITTYKETNQLQSSCISLPTATAPVRSYTIHAVWQT